MTSFAGKTAFITGGASGTGLGLARAFQQAGARVVIADLFADRLAEAERSLGAGERLAIELDVTDRGGWAEAADMAEARFGQVDILCNNAGVNSEIPIAEARYEDWDWILGVNLGGCINGMTTFVPRFRARGGGAHILNTSSILGVIPMGAAALYTTSKFAVRGLSAAARLALAPDRIGVSCLCPGLVRTRGMEAEASRPARLAVRGRSATPLDANAIAATNALGMDPLEVGRRALAGIAANAELIFTHAEHAGEAGGLMRDMLAAFPIDDPVPDGRAGLEEELRVMRAGARAAASLPHSPALRGNGLPQSN